MSADFSRVVAGLRRHDRLPERYESVYVSGSLVRGWGNETSDLDIAVVTAEPWRRPTAQTAYVALDPDVLPQDGLVVDGRRWDIEYWSDAQVDQVLDKLSWAEFDGGRPTWKRLTQDEISFLEKLPYARQLTAGPWLSGRQQQLRESAHRSIFVAHALDHADNYIEDAVGQLGGGDTESAVVTVKIAFGHAVDALLASQGQFGSLWPKWRARRFRLADPPIVSFAEYWAVETMATFDPAAPGRWVDEVLLLCRRIAAEVEM